MKNIKKLLSIVMVLTLVLALGASALAVNITINDENAAGSIYTYYRLMDVAGNSFDSAGQPLFRYTINEKYRSIIQQVITEQKIEGYEVLVSLTGDKLDYALVECVSHITEGAPSRAFADALLAKIKANVPAIEPEHTQKAAENGVTQWEAPDGYYLIAETVAEGTEEGVASLVLLDTLTTAHDGMTSVNTKEDKPSSKKTVTETNDTTDTTNPGQLGADYDIGDDIPFQLSATISDKSYGSYDKYYLQFVDDMCASLGMPENVKIYWKDAEGTEYNLTQNFTADEPTTSTAHEGGKVYTWTCEDIKTLGVPAGATIYLDYTAELLESARMGVEGNPNTSRVVYSSDPYSDSKGHTPDKKVTVYTFDLDVYKVDGTNVPLEGAGFTLFKKVPAETEGAAAKADHEGVWVQVGDEVTGEKTSDGKICFTFEGLDSGEYFLEETTVPPGFNKANDIEFKVVAVLNEDGTIKELQTPEGQTVTAKTDKSGYETTVINQNGLELPSTGGIGTTIFYVVGAILVAGAVILLVTKKRVNGASK